MRELCPDHQLLAVGMLVLRGRIAAVERVRIAGHLPRVLRVRRAGRAVLLLAASRRHGADGGQADGEPQATPRESRDPADAMTIARAPGRWKSPMGWSRATYGRGEAERLPGRANRWPGNRRTG